MTEFVDISLSFPTVIFTFLLGLALIYWLLVILGALDMDMLDPGHLFHAADGALEGAHGALDGAGEGAGEALHGALDHHDLGDAFSLFGFLGLRGVPLTLVLSIIVLVGWVTSGVSTIWLRGALPEGWWVGTARWLVFGGLAVSALATGMLSAAVLLRPLRGIYRSRQARSRHSLVGSVGVVTTQRVDAQFGQAEFVIEDDCLLVEVRSEEENELAKGSRVLIFDYDATHEVFHVIAHGND